MSLPWKNIDEPVVSRSPYVKFSVGPETLQVFNGVESVGRKTTIRIGTKTLDQSNILYLLRVYYLVTDLKTIL